jgi:hypothetical protein
VTKEPVVYTGHEVHRFKIMCELLGIKKGQATPLQVLRRDYNFRGRTATEGRKFAECLLRNGTY